MTTDIIIAALFFILGLIPAYYFYRKSIRIKEPVYSIRSVNVISDYASTYADLAVSYKGEKVESFTVSKVLFFNRGVTALDRNDIAALNPVRIESISGNILDATVLQVNSPSSRFEVSVDRANQSIIMDFDYLNQNHGAVIEVIHTSLSSKDLQVVGDMKEVKELIRISPFSMRTLPPPTYKALIGKLALVFLGWLTAFTLLLFAYRALATNPSGFIVAVYALLLVLSALGLVLVLFFYLFPPTPIIPRGLEKFNE